MEPEMYGPRAPIRMFVYRYYHPVYRQMVTLDCPAITVELALDSAVRFMRRQQEQGLRCGFTLRIPRRTRHMRLEG